MRLERALTKKTKAKAPHLSSDLSHSHSKALNTPSVLVFCGPVLAYMGSCPPESRLRKQRKMTAVKSSSHCGLGAGRLLVIPHGRVPNSTVMEKAECLPS